MKKRNRKKVIFSLVCGFAISLIAGLGLPSISTHEAKAAYSGFFPIDDYNIENYEWANYFNAGSTSVIPSLYSQHILEDVFEVVNDRWTYPLPYISLRVKDRSLLDGKGSFSFSLQLCWDISPDYNPIKDLVIGQDYVFNFNMSCSGSEFISLDEEKSGLYIGDFIEVGEWPDGDTLYDRSNGYFMSMLEPSTYRGFLSPENNYVDLVVTLTNVSLLQNGDVIRFSNYNLSKGTYAYSYSDYFYDLDEGFPSPRPVPLGYDHLTFDDGYEDGYIAGIAESQYGFLGTADIRLVITYPDNSVSNYTITPTRIAGGLDFTNIYNTYVPNLDGIVSSSRLEFYFNPFVRPSALSLYGEGSSYFFNSNISVYPEVIGNSNPILNWQPSSDNSFLYETTLIRGDNLGNWKATSISTVNFTSFDYLRGLRLFVTDYNFYENGYLVGSGEGYDKGYHDGLDASQQEVYDNAYNEGHRVGYDDGFVVGSRANNSFLGLFTAIIDAPVLTLTSLLDFNILGYNMKSVVLSLLSIALVVAIIRLFSKGGSAG